VATPDVVKLVRQQASPDFLAKFWNPLFPGQIPDRLVIAEELKRNVIDLEGHDLVVVEAFPVGSRVMFTGPYGVSENGTYSEWVAVRKESLYSIPDNIEDVSASGVPAVACDWRVRRKLCVTSLRAAPLRQGRSHDLTSANEDFRAFFPVQPTTQLRLWPVLGCQD